MAHKGFVHNHSTFTPNNARLNMYAAQIETAEVLDEFIEHNPIDRAEFSSYPSLLRAPIPLSLQGTGLVRESAFGGNESGWSIDRASRTKQTAKILGRTIGSTTVSYTFMAYATDSEGRSSTCRDLEFEVGDPDDSLDMGDYNWVTRSTDSAISNSYPLARKIYLKVEELMPDTEKPQEVHKEVWLAGKQHCNEALYFMLRKKSQSTRGARNIVNQTLKPTIDQIDDIAYYNGIKSVNIATALRESVFRSR